VLELRYLYGLRKHDVVLYQFCEVRRQLMRLLRAEGEQMTREDYVYAREILDAVSQTIEIYGDHKSRMFNARWFFRFLKAYRISSKEMAALPRTASPKLREIENVYGRAVLSGFLAFTPFFRSELALRFMLSFWVVLATLCAKLGVKWARNYAKEGRGLAKEVLASAAFFVHELPRSCTAPRARPCLSIQNRLDRITNSHLVLTFGRSARNHIRGASREFCLFDQSLLLQSYGLSPDAATLLGA
jgi:hypothetical protein